MADIFLKEDVINLLKNKYVLMMGDSNMRCIYKDIIWLMTTGNITPVKSFHAAMAKNPFCGDKIIDRSEISNGRDYYEIREYKNSACENLLLRYHFITRVYGKSVQIALDNIEKGTTPAPKIVILNSCLWDLNRWGPSQEDAYKSNLVKLFQRLQSILPDDSLVLWITTPPVACEQTKGGLFIQQLQFMKHSLRFMIMEANLFIQQLCIAFEYDVLDLHYHMRHQLNSRAKDGIHWEPHAMRHITNLLLTHLALSFDIQLPNLITNSYIMSAKHRAVEAVEGVKVDIHLDKLVLDEVFGKNAVNVVNTKHKPISWKTESPVALTNSTKENIVTAIADTTSPPETEKISLKTPITENGKIKSAMKTHNSIKNVETSKNISIVSTLSNNSLKADNFTAKCTVSTTGTTTSPVGHNNDLTTQSSLSVAQNSSVVSVSSSIANTTVSSSAVSSTSGMQKLITMEGLATNKPENRVIKTAKRRVITTKKQEKVLAQQELEGNLQDCILNILNAPDSTTSQILLESIDSIGNETSSVSRRGMMRGTSRGQISMSTGSRGTPRGSSMRGDTVRGGAIRGIQPRGRGLLRVGTLDMFKNELEYSNMNSQHYDFMEWGDTNWREGMECDDYNAGYDLGNIDYTSDDVWSSVTDSQGCDNSSSRNSVLSRLGTDSRGYDLGHTDYTDDVWRSETHSQGFDNSSSRNSILNRLGTKFAPQSGFNNIDFRSRQEMPLDNYHFESQCNSPHMRWDTNQQNDMPLNHFHSEFQNAASYYQRETDSHNSNLNHQYLQQFNSYLQTDQQRFPSYSMGPQQRGPRNQWDGPRQWEGPGNNIGYMGPNDSTPFWNNYPTNNFPWNNRY